MTLLFERINTYTFYSSWDRYYTYTLKISTIPYTCVYQGAIPSRRITMQTWGWADKTRDSLLFFSFSRPWWPLSLSPYLSPQLILPVNPSRRVSLLGEFWTPLPPPTPALVPSGNLPHCTCFSMIKFLDFGIFLSSKPYILHLEGNILFVVILLTNDFWYYGY